MLLNHIWTLIKHINYLAIVDVTVVTWLLYRLLLLAKGTRAWQIIGGLLVFVAVLVLSDRLQLYTLNWLLKQALPLGPVAMVILFLPELRHALEEFGRPAFWGSSLGLVKTEEMSEMLDAVVVAVDTMAIKRVGALIVFERDAGLEDIIGTGTPINSIVSVDLLCTLFYKGTPLHDGAVIIRHDRIAAAGCTLPLTVSPRVDATVHTRHKAALGMSEDSDAVVVVVSEETGTISIACNGKLLRGLRDDTLRVRLAEYLQLGPSATGRTPIGRVANRVGDAIKTARTARKPGQ